MSRIFTFLISLLLILSFTTYAKVMPYPDVIKQLNVLLTNKQYAQAYQLSDEYTFEYGGLPEFDLLSGFSAYGHKQYQEAVFAFERVVIEVPNSYLARFYLAQTYQKLDNLQAAVAELNRLLKRPLLDNQRDSATKLLNRINKTILNKNKTWGHFISGMMAFDDNINSGTAEEQIFIPNLGEIQLFDNSRQTRDLTYSFNYKANYQHPISQNQWLKVNIGANYVDYLEFNEYQRHMVNFDLAYAQKSKVGTLSVSGFARPLWLNGTHYRTEAGASSNWQSELSKSSGIMSSLSYSVISNELNSELDLSRTKLSVSYLLKSSQVHTIMAHWQQDVSDDSRYVFNDKDVIGAMYQLTWPITDSVISNNSFMVEQHTYKGVHPLFLQERDETMSMFSSQLMFNSTDRLNLKLHLNVQNKSSNIKLYSYDRVELGASWQYEL
ncbi:surface lipoprotein assembly modifier [uncultured Psychrosphaera sp.]|uniref:surface lipoprotein assembly modifier n=1 Tax=uncultured Psychrosphaera sp. TaxID=1403522 RepID=UPI0030F62B39